MQTVTKSQEQDEQAPWMWPRIEAEICQRNKWTLCNKLVLSTVDKLQLHRKCTILSLSLPCSVQATACTSPEPDEYRLYPELPTHISVCPCETEIWLYRMDFKQFLRIKILILWLTTCAAPLAMQCVILQ